MATVLVVEDEETIREIIQITLESQGHKVLTAGRAYEAIDISAAHNDLSLDLLLTDAILPGITGWELAQIISRTESQIKVLLMSGGSQEQIVGSKGWPFIQKPFDLSDLVRRVDSMLGSSV